MNKLEYTSVDVKHTEPGSGREYVSNRFESDENRNVDCEEQSPSHDLYQKTPAELGRIEELQQQISESYESDSLLEQPTLGNPTEVEVVDGHPYHVEYVPKEDIYPAYGYGGGDSAVVRQDLPPRVKKFVKAHELYHCQDKATWGGWLGREIRANVIPGLKDPVGLGATILKTITDADRLKFYLNRIRRGY